MRFLRVVGTRTSLLDSSHEKRASLDRFQGTAFPDYRVAIITITEEPLAQVRLLERLVDR